MPSELVWVALIAAIGPVIGFFAKPLADAVSDWLRSGERRRTELAAAVREVQDAMAAYMRMRTTADYGAQVKAAKAHALMIHPLAERIADDMAREAVKALVEQVDRDANIDDIGVAYREASEALGLVLRR